MNTIRNKRILLTGGGGAASEAFYRLLEGRYEVFLADADPEAKPYGIPSDRWHFVPMAESPSFIPSLKLLVQKLEADLLVPTVDEELLPISRIRGEIACNVLLPDESFLLRHLDKYACMNWLQENAIPCPVTEKANCIERVTFPCIVKPRRGRGSRGVMLVQSPEHLEAYLLLSGMNPDEIIVQEFVEGPEYTVTVVSNKDKLIQAIVPVLIGRKRGITIRAVTKKEDDVIGVCEKLLEAAPVQGVVNIQLIKTPNGIRVFEINPRISTTACLVLASGVNLFELFESQVSKSSFMEGLRLKRSWFNEFHYNEGEN